MFVQQVFWPLRHVPCAKNIHLGGSVSLNRKSALSPSNCVSLRLFLYRTRLRIPTSQGARGLNEYLVQTATCHALNRRL